MRSVRAYVGNFRDKSRKKRARLFRRSFALGPTTKILDLGSETGAHIHAVLSGTEVKPENVFIADIDEEALLEGKRKYGFNPVLIDESGKLAFADKYFDIVFCSSVIEHVTVPKKLVWVTFSGKEFGNKADHHQFEFAKEIVRLGTSYFVQTPYRWFLFESHSWLPFLGWMPRRVIIPILRFTNKFWIKKTAPDWHLLNRRQLGKLFPEAEVCSERYAGMVKSIIAIGRPYSQTS